MWSVFEPLLEQRGIYAISTGLFSKPSTRVFEGRKRSRIKELPRFQMATPNYAHRQRRWGIQTYIKIYFELTRPLVNNRHLRRNFAAFSAAKKYIKEDLF